jgi:hypothetical protein
MLGSRKNLAYTRVVDQPAADVKVTRPRGRRTGRPQASHFFAVLIPDAPLLD